METQTIECGVRQRLASKASLTVADNALCSWEFEEKAPTKTREIPEESESPNNEFEALHIQICFKQCEKPIGLHNDHTFMKLNTYMH